jgi:hypothetical protein
MLESLEMNGFMLVVWIVSIKQCARRNIFLIWLKDGITMLEGVKYRVPMESDEDGTDKR